MSQIRKPAVLLVATLMFAMTCVSAQEPLTLRDAIQLSINLNPSRAAAQAETQEARAGVAQAHSQLLPQVNFAEDISRGDDPVYVFGTRLRQRRFTQEDFALDALNSPDAIGNFATRVSGSWLLFDSLGTQKNIRSAGLMKHSADEYAKAVDQKIVFDVVQAYQGVLYAERQVQVAEHEVDTAQALLASVDDRVRAGLAVESDRMSAQVNLSTARQELIAAQGAVELAWAQLRVAVGSPELPQSKLQPIEPKEFPETPLQQELETATKARPDLAGMCEAQQAQATSLSAAKWSYGPHVSAYGNWEDDRPSWTQSGGDNWVAGVQVSIDILPFAKRANVARETAVKARVDAQLASDQQQTRLEVSQAHIQRQTAQHSLETARDAIEQATESLRILRNRYGAGLATITDLLHAEDAERQAQSSYWHAVYANTVAYAHLLFATGTLTPDAAEELQ
jgi:outer membrane protein